MIIQFINSHMTRLFTGISRSGYFTSRSYWKALDRLVETTLRTAEVLHVLARAVSQDEVAAIDVVRS